MQVEGGEYENQPVRRTDVIREEDRMDEEELPEAGQIAGQLCSSNSDMLDGLFSCQIRATPR